jgi:hypothetical protein
MRLVTTVLKLLGGFSAAVAISVAAHGFASDEVEYYMETSASGSITVRGPEVPFPLSSELPFPWGNIEGTWELHGKGIDALFSFEVQSDCAGRKVLRVLHLDPDNRAVIAEGTGIGVDDKKIVRAAMGGKYGNYMLFIGAFKNPKPAGPETVTVLTIRSFTGVGNTDLQAIVRKVSNEPHWRRNFPGAVPLCCGCKKQ